MSDELSSPFPKNLEHVHKVRWCYPFPNRLAERKWGLATMRRIIQATYHIFLSWHHLVMSTLLVLRILKNTVLSMLFCKLFIVFWDPLTKKCIWIIVSKVKFQNGYSIQHIKTQCTRSRNTKITTLPIIAFYWWNTRGYLWMSHVANWDRKYKDYVYGRC